MSSETAIRATGLSKRYELLHGDGGSYLTLRERVAAMFRRRARVQREEFWALQGIDFEIRRGARIGLIGRNGAGKSTLLKILSRITPPSRGRVEIHGRVASLLEVGTGFHPELTGRENIFLNGSILGMSRVEIRSRFDEIVAFAEVERFLDTPVKRYSSGMYVRLAFAVAAHLEPDILIVDEVLAVGDLAFQRKCLGKMEDIASRDGRTVLLVSHNLSLINSLANRCLLLEGGRLAADGPPAEVTRHYAGASQGGGGAALEWRPADSTRLPFAKSVEILSFAVTDARGTAAAREIRRSGDARVRIRLRLREHERRLGLIVLFYNSQGERELSVDLQDVEPGAFDRADAGAWCFEFPFPGDLLATGQHFIELVSLVHKVGWILQADNSSRMRFEFIDDCSENPYHHESAIAPLTHRAAWQMSRED